MLTARLTIRPPEYRWVSVEAHVNIWGDADATVGPDAAYGTADFVKPSFAMEVLPGVGHFVMDQAPARATELLLAHLAKHPV